jgi:hypothetical protein
MVAPVAEWIDMRLTGNFVPAFYEPAAPTLESALATMPTSSDVPSRTPLDEDAVALIAKLESDESTAAVRRRRRVR